MDWVTTIRDEAQRSSLLHTDELARKYKIVPVAVTQALSRQERRGLVEHISSKVYFNYLATDATPRELVNVLRPKAYISLESALHEYGISTQSPQVLTCVTQNVPGNSTPGLFASAIAESVRSCTGATGKYEPDTEDTRLQSQRKRCLTGFI